MFIVVVVGRQKSGMLLWVIFEDKDRRPPCLFRLDDMVVLAEGSAVCVF